MDGLTNLTTIGGGHVGIGANASLRLVGDQANYAVENIAAFASLTVLANVDGLASLEKIGYALSIQGNAGLKNLNGLAKLGAVGGKFSGSSDVSANASLDNVAGLGAPYYVGGTFEIFDNPSLCLSQVNALIAALTASVSAQLSAYTDGSACK
jgi:hypothetical protein